MSVPTTSAVDLPPVPPAWQSPTFWLTHAAALVALLTGLGVIGPDFAKRHEDVVNAVALLAATLAPALWAFSHVLAHKAHLQAYASIVGSTAANTYVLTPPSAAPADAPPDAPVPVAEPAPDLPDTSDVTDGGYGIIGLLGVLAAAVGLILILIVALGTHALSVPGVVLLVIGAVVACFDGGSPLRRR